MNDRDAKDYAELLEESGESANAMFHEFTLAFWGSQNDIFAFFEGEDDLKFYLPVMRPLKSGRQIHRWVCNGRSTVLALRSMVRESEASSAAIMFFIDRDFDTFLGRDLDVGDDTYVTEWYSVENYLVDERTIEVMWDDFVPIPRGECFNSMLNAFRSERDNFARKMRTVTAWCIAQRRLGNRLNLSNVDLSSVLTMKASGTFAKKKNGYRKFARAALVDNNPVPLSEIRRAYKELAEYDCRVWVRGKFHAWFLRKYLTFWWPHIRQAVKAVHSNRNPKEPDGVRSGNLFETFGARIGCPESAAAFINSRMSCH